MFGSGLLTSAVHGSTAIGKEIETNLNLLRRAFTILDRVDCHEDLSNFTYRMVYSKKYAHV